MRRRLPLVGRHREVESISDALMDRDVHGVVIVGAGGIGKTRLAREALTLGERAGFSTLTVQATRASSTLPLGVFAGAFHHDPGVGDHDPGAGDALGRARAAVLDRAAEVPLLLFVDDAHHLDPVSATLLLSVIRDPRVFVLATVRSGEPAPDAVTTLWKDAEAIRIEVRALGHDDLERLLHEALGGPVASGTVATLVDRSAGNPMALLELIRSARESGGLRQQDGVWHLVGTPPLSGRIVELVEDRLGRLHDAQRDTLGLVALGEPLRLDVLESIVGREPVRALEDRDILTVEPDATGDRVRGSHPLFGDVLLADMGSLNRRRLLETLADAVAGTETLSDDDLLRVASWRLESGVEADAGLMIEAARVAYFRTDYGTTAELAEASWNADPSAEAGYLWGFSLSRHGATEQADQVLCRAADLAGDDRLRSLTTMARAENLFRGLNDIDTALDVTCRSEAAVSDPIWRDELKASRASFHMQAGHPDEAWRLVEPLLEPGAPARPLVKAAYVAGPMLALDGQTDAALTLAVRALPIHERVWAEDLFQTEPTVHHVTALLAHIEAGHLHQAEVYADVALRTANETGVVYGIAFMATMAALVAFRRGRVTTGGFHCREAAQAFAEAGYQGQQRWALGGAALAAARQGDLARAERYIARADLLASRTPIRFNEAPVDDARGWVLYAQGRPEEAREHLSAAADRAVDARERAGAALLLHSLARLGDPGRAVDRLTEIDEGTDGDLIPLRKDHARALADADPDGLDKVAERFAGIGADLFAAEAAAEAARHHRRRGSARRAAASARRSEELLTACEGAATPALVATAHSDPLTGREREVALLAARGLASKEIAERLSVSRRTVDNHLHRAYRKLGVDRRGDLAQALGVGG